MAITPPTEGNASIRFGTAFIRPSEEKGYYELMRPIIIVKNEGDRITTESNGEQAFGPIAVYRIARKGDRMPTQEEVVAHGSGPPLRIKSSDPKTNTAIELVLVHFPGMDK